MTKMKNPAFCRYFCSILSFSSFLLISFLFLFPFVSRAASITVTPAVVDTKGLPRDIIKQSLQILNPSNQKQEIYIFVNNVSTQEGRQDFTDPAKADYSSSLANWLDITRGVIDLMPGQSVNIDYKISINLTAKPGMYHAIISFATGSTREDAQNNLAGGASVMVNAEVLEDARIEAQLKGFSASKDYFTSMPVRFRYNIENIGNRGVEPTGEIIVYNRRGQEIDSITLSSAGQVILPGQAANFEAQWQKPRLLGKYKAVLALKYGTNQASGLNDTVYFWVLPWPAVLLVFLILIALLALSVFLRRLAHQSRLEELAEFSKKAASSSQVKIIVGQPPQQVQPRPKRIV